MNRTRGRPAVRLIQLPGSPSAPEQGTNLARSGLGAAHSRPRALQPSPLKRAEGFELQRPEERRSNKWVMLLQSHYPVHRRRSIDDGVTGQDDRVKHKNLGPTQMATCPGKKKNGNLCAMTLYKCGKCGNVGCQFDECTNCAWESHGQRCSSCGATHGDTAPDGKACRRQL